MRTPSTILLLLLSFFPARAQSPPQAPAAPLSSSATTARTGTGALAPDHVAGLVLSTTDKHPIAQAIVTLREVRGRRPQAITRTNAEGRYSFEPQPVGKYNLQASAPGYLNSSYLEHGTFSTAIVLGAGLKTDALTLQLTHSARIAGHVLDASGEPVERATLTLYRENLSATVDPASDAPDPSPRITRTRSMQTAEDGSFEFTGVAPGSFYLSASATPWYAVHPRADNENSPVPYRIAIDPALDVAYPEIFYPHARSAEEAAPFTVKAGDRISADMILQPEHALSVTFRLPAPEPGQPLNFRLPQLSHTVFGIQEQVPVQNTGGFGQQITLSGISPGRYSLQILAPNSRSRSEMGSVGTVDLVGESIVMDLPTGAGQQGVTAEVSVHTAGGEPLPTGLQVFVRKQGSNLNAQPVKDGAAAFTNLASGEYRLAASVGGRSFPMVALAQDGKPVPDRRLRVSGSAPVKADLTLSLYAPAIEGRVQHESHAMPGSMVVLVPAGASTSPDLFRRDQSDLDGSFTLQSVAPGHYLLVAIDEGWTLRWNDPATLLPYLLHALPVNIPTSGPATISLSETAISQSR